MNPPQVYMCIPVIGFNILSSSVCLVSEHKTLKFS